MRSIQHCLVWERQGASVDCTVLVWEFYDHTFLLLPVLGLSGGKVSVRFCVVMVVFPLALLRPSNLSVGDVIGSLPGLHMSTGEKEREEQEEDSIFSRITSTLCNWGGCVGGKGTG